MNLRFSDSEQHAFETIRAWGFSDAEAAAFIGRAQKYLASQKLSADEIIAHVIELINFDETQKKYLERAAKETAEARLVDWLAATSNDPIISDFRDTLRDMVATERAKAGLENPKGELRLYPTKAGASSFGAAAIGEGQIGGRNYKAFARLERDGAGQEFLKISLIPK
jgi:hypothetical protein